jgi:hypothetical protein
LRIFLSKAGPFVPGAHTRGARHILRRLVRDLLLTSNMTMVYFIKLSATVRAVCGPKKTENLCGVFDALCYIPALLTNQN